MLAGRRNALPLIFLPWRARCAKMESGDAIGPARYLLPVAARLANRAVPAIFDRLCGGRPSAAGPCSFIQETVSCTARSNGPPSPIDCPRSRPAPRWSGRTCCCAQEEDDQEEQEERDDDDLDVEEIVPPVPPVEQVDDFEEDDFDDDFDDDFEEDFDDDSIEVDEGDLANASDDEPDDAEFDD